MAVARHAVPLLAAGHTDATLEAALLHHVWRPTRRAWWAAFVLSIGGLVLLAVSIAVTVTRGIGTWGNNVPVGWAFGIINFVWWIGIGHAGTLISAILLLFQQRWRTSINRFAEAMTLFAVVCAGLFPILHLGRPWLAWWLLPYPSTLGVWPQFKSPLVWDVFAISTYLTISFLFWYLGLIPDLAALRDSSPTLRQRRVYGVLALGWRGAARHWRHYRIGYLLLAGISTPLVVSVHTIVSFDFATSLVPGWHATIFPPYFVAGAVFSGFAMVLTLLIPARRLLGLEDVVTLEHFDKMHKVMLATGLIVTYGYLMEHWVAWYSGSEYEWTIFYETRARGTYAPVYWLMLFCNVAVPQLLWSRRVRRSLIAGWVVAILVNVGMWCERFVIIVTSLSREYLPSKWEDYAPTWVDVGLFVGSLGLFSFLFLLFVRFLPAVAVTEVKELRAELAHVERLRPAISGGPLPNERVP